MGQLQSITLAAPGFWGVNTQDSPLGIDVRYCAEGNNAVIDKHGRLGARKGTVAVSTNGGAVLGSSAGIEMMSEFLQEDGSTVQFSAGNNLLFTGTTTLVDATPGAATVTANNWQAATLSNKHYFFQSGHTPLVYTPSGAITRIVDEGAYTGTVPQGDVVLSSFGRLFVASTTTEKSVISWSDLLNGLAWSGGSAGSIDLQKFWPRGYDEITALVAHNNFLVVFGKTSTLIFSGANSPSTMVLSDTVENIGCVARDSVASNGKDVYFLSASGLRTLGRTIQEKSSPIGDASKNVNDDVKTVYNNETGNIRGHYNEGEGFYVLSFPSQVASFVFDTRYPLEDGSLRATSWTALIPLSMSRTTAGDFYIGTAAGIEKYSGNLDAGVDTYDMTWLTHPTAFEAPANLKFLKHIHATLLGNGNTCVVRWAWDYTTQYTTGLLTLPVSDVAEYGIAEYGIAEYSASISLSNEHVTGNGSGRVLTSGLTTTINGFPFSIQQFQIQATIGRVL